jgi:hypothetical protein
MAARGRGAADSGEVDLAAPWSTGHRSADAVAPMSATASLPWGTAEVTLGAFISVTLS